ncbi:Peptidoglycan-binding (PGRP) domain of peptidoglycan hydrolases-containing protein [Thermomonospora echinospora]|uniref:Peptidoglycan-binding (PGRP) domain of peptidoglycan hydrolases-containing protein n=1 Tax=Thermomonospora echinospora TaxID=1992 RepID=A0A1H5T4I7_9ACTN|nr:peptidoglycan-binding protein [Thermomonospora echinospora]SEF57664.1 Peptidoglycan-binding (PGRP) domain of peptidoglycan hydrolases-containing protein [Thermomonospora echinospora]
MNLKRMAITALATVGIMTTGAALAGPASADPEPYTGDPYTQALQLSWPVLKQGQTSEEVRTLQWLLNCHGKKVDVPSRFGPKTHAAVYAFQAELSDRPDGVVGTATWALLIGKGSIVYGGTDNDCVRALQVALNKWRYNDDLPITGYLGPRTKAKLHKFQSAHGLPATDQPDAKTWNKLIATPAGK